MAKILIRSTLLLILVGFALPSVAQAQRYGHGGTHHSRSYGHHTSQRGYRPHYRRTHHRPTYRTHRTSYGRYSYRPSFHHSTPYRSRSRFYVRRR